MNLRKATGRIVLVGLSAFLLLACGLAWAQKEEEKGKNEKSSSTHTSKPASKPAPRSETSRPSTPSRPSNNNGASRGTNTNNERGGNTNNENRNNNVSGANNNRPENNNRPAANNGENRNAGGQPGGNRPVENNNANRNPGGEAGGNRAGGNANARPANGFGPTHTVSRGGFTANVAAGGRVTTIRGNNITVNNYGPRGGHTVIATRPGGVRVVSFGGHAGWVDHPFVRGGVPFVTRTYIGFGGRPFASVYMGIGFRGGIYYHYVPAWRFAPAFYGWAWRPWAAPIRFGWGWGPWFGFYGYYFNPYPVYPSASLWLTDYIIAQNLQAAYAAQQAAAADAAANSYPPPPPNPAAYSTPLSPELKQAIADEVAAQLAEQQQDQAPPGAAPGASPPPAAQPNSVPGALDPKIRTFIVNAGMNETLTSGAECPLAPGDVLTRIDDNPDANGNVHVLVSSSQANDCASGSQILMSAQTLQDMHNAFRQQIDGGLTQLSQSQGKNGIPMGPAGNPTANPDGTAQPDASAATDLQTTDQQAAQAQSQVQGAGSAQ